MMSIAEKRKGQGKLRNCIFPDGYFKVEYSLWQTRVVASADRPLVRHFGHVEYIRVLDGTRMPSGKYNLELGADQRAEIVGVQKRCDNWELLPVEMRAYRGRHNHISQKG